MTGSVRLLAGLAVFVWLAAATDVQGQVWVSSSTYNPLTGTQTYHRSYHNQSTGEGSSTTVRGNPFTGAASRRTTSYNDFTGRYESNRQSYNPSTGYRSTTVRVA